jgi:hypothetical protein
MEGRKTNREGGRGEGRGRKGRKEGDGLAGKKW